MDNLGRKFSNTVGVKIDDNLYVFGKNTGGWLKMVAVDRTGANIKQRYIGPQNNAPHVVTKELWEGGIDNSYPIYDVEDVNMACVGM